VKPLGQKGEKGPIEPPGKKGCWKGWEGVLFAGRGVSRDYSRAGPEGGRSLMPKKGKRPQSGLEGRTVRRSFSAGTYI